MAQKVLNPECNYSILEELIYIVGPPVRDVKTLCLGICDHLNFNRETAPEGGKKEYSCVSVAGLLRKEISKKSSSGQKIEEAMKKNVLVEDSLVIDLVKKHVR